MGNSAQKRDISNQTLSELNNFTWYCSPNGDKYSFLLNFTALWSLDFWDQSSKAKKTHIYQNVMCVFREREEGAG